MSCGSPLGCTSGAGQPLLDAEDEGTRAAAAASAARGASADERRRGLLRLLRRAHEQRCSEAARIAGPGVTTSRPTGPIDARGDDPATADGGRDGSESRASRTSSAGACWSKPVAMTVMRSVSPIESSMTAPKMMLQSSWAASWTSEAASSTSWSLRSGPAVMLIRMPLRALDGDVFEQRAVDRLLGRRRRRGLLRSRCPCPSARDPGRT